ncbi:MAG: metallophosphoesterase family protein, partial [Dehalococcoidia bacterium]|nr:metallophosphoesterase family protein [Dehalococcoidia bacterium]
MTRIMVISDTHVRSLKELSQELVNTLSEVDYVVHCGDYNNIAVLQELRRLAKRF